MNNKIINTEYDRGYQAAIHAIVIGGENAQKLFNQSYGNDDQFTIGWQKACEENKAINPLD